MEASKFLYEQAHGKAIARTEVIGKHVHVTYNLSGTDEPIPDEIIEQLDADD